MLRERPLLVPFWAMACGLTFSYLSGATIPLHAVAAALVCLLLSLFVRTSFVFAACLALFFFLWGVHALEPWLAADSTPGAVQLKAARDPILLEGVVESRPVNSAAGASLILRCDRLLHADGGSEMLHGRVLLTVAAGEVTVSRGDRIRCLARIVVPRLLGLPGEFDYRRFLAMQGVSAAARVASADWIVLVRGAEEESFLRTMDRVALRLAAAVRSAVPDEGVSSVLTALVLGDQKRIPADLADAYTRAGVNHILSISGFHIGIIAVFITLALFTLLSRFERIALYLNLRRTVLLAALPAMLVYLLLTGAAPATTRSVIMLAAFVLALYVERESDPVNTLLVAASVLLVLNPPTLFDISFQLSFVALWGIIISAPFAQRLLPQCERKWQRQLISFFSVSLAASLVTALPVLYVFKQASLNGVVTNVLIVPLLGYGAVLAGFCSMPLLLIAPGWAPWLLWPAAQLVRISNSLVMSFAQLPQIRFNGISSVDMLLFIIFLCCLTFLRRRSLRIVCAAALPAVAVGGHLLLAPAPDGRLHISMLSVGQAESLLLRFPSGAIMLVDGGGYLHDTGRDFGRQVLVPSLAAHGVDRIDYLVATHGHPDHAGGLPYLLAALPTGELWEAGGNMAGLEQVRAVAAARMIPGRRLVAGDRLTLLDSVSIEVVSPAADALQPGAGDEEDQNERSLVFRLTYGRFSMLFTADAGFAAEQRMLSSGAPLAAAVLKIGHHGSRYSTSDEFLERVRPQVALISAGADNRFGLPAGDTLQQLARHHIAVYRTDRDGTIELVTNGIDWSISTPHVRQ